MSSRPSITFSKSLPAAEGGTLVVLTDQTLALGAAATGLGIADIAVAIAAYARLSGEWEPLRARLTDRAQNPTPQA